MITSKEIFYFFFVDGIGQIFIVDFFHDILSEVGRNDDRSVLFFLHSGARGGPKAAGWSRGFEITQIVHVHLIHNDFSFFDGLDGLVKQIGNRVFWCKGNVEGDAGGGEENVQEDGDMLRSGNQADRFAS